MGENGIPPAGHFFNEPADGLGWSAAVATPAAATRPAALSDAYQISPVKISRNFWGIDFCRGCSES